MKWLAVALLPSKDDKSLISYAELAAGKTKDLIRVQNNQIFELNSQWVDKVHRLIQVFAKKLETNIPTVFWAHKIFNLTQEQQKEAWERMFCDIPQPQIHCRTYYPQQDLSSLTIDAATISEINGNFWIKVNFNEDFGEKHDAELDEIAKIFATGMKDDMKSRFVWLHPCDWLLITQIIKKWWKWRERFWTHLCRHLWGERNICVKPLWVNPNPPFSDVTATYIADILDQKTWDAPRIVEAIR